MSRADISAGKAHIELYVKNSKFVQGLNRASKQLSTFGKDLTKIGASFAAAGASVLGPLASTLSVASDIEEQMNKFNVVFGESANVMKAWGDATGDAMGRSKLQMATFLAATQDLLVPMGFAADHAEEMSKEITKLAIDLASFNNLADDDVMRDLQSALTGSSEVMKKYGVIVSAAAVNQELMNNALDPKVATEAQKAQARLAIIMRGTTAAHGDAERSAGSFANQMKAIQAEVSNVAAEIGSVLLPVVSGIMPHVKRAVSVFSEFAKNNQGVIKVVAAVGVALVAVGGVFMSVGVPVLLLGKAIAAVTFAAGVAATAITGLGAIFAAITSPIGLVVVGLGALAYWFFTATDAGKAFGSKIMATFGQAAKFIMSTVSAIFDALAGGQFETAGTIAATAIEVAFRSMFDRVRAMAFDTARYMAETIVKAPFGGKAEYKSSHVASVGTMEAQQRLRMASASIQRPATASIPAGALAGVGGGGGNSAQLQQLIAVQQKQLQQQQMMIQELRMGRAVYQ